MLRNLYLFNSPVINYISWSKSISEHSKDKLLSRMEKEKIFAIQSQSQRHDSLGKRGPQAEIPGPT